MNKVKDKTYNELKRYLLNEDITKTYHYYRFGLCIISTVQGMEDNGSGIEILIDGGVITVWSDSMITRVLRPANLIKDCENCYSLTNEYGEPIGYVYN
jgi:hypothetical protein